jgi:hypothetical protein
MTLTKVTDRMTIGTPDNLKDFGAVGDVFLEDGTLNPSPTDDTAAIQAALDASLDLYIPDGTYNITAGLTCTGKRRIIYCSPRSAISYSGPTSGVALTIGDGGSTVTLNNVITNLRLIDATDGPVMVDALLALDACSYSSFYNLKTMSRNGVKISGGAGLRFDASVTPGVGSITNAFYSYRSAYCNKAIQFSVGAGANDNHFFGMQVAGAGTYAVKGEMAIDYPTGATSNSVNFFGGSIQAYKRGVVMGAPPSSWKLDGLYFEGLPDGSIIEEHASAKRVITITNCRFKGAVATNAHIVSTATGLWDIRNTEFHDAPLIELNNVSAIVTLSTNSPVGGFAEVVETLSSRWIETAIDGTGNYELNQGQGVVQNNQFTLPQAQVGEVSVPGAGNVAVTFATAWPAGSTVKVSATLVSSSSDGAVSVGTVGISGFTLYNHNTTTKNISWVASRV